MAEKGLQTINEVKENIPLLGLAKVSPYKSTWLAIKSLNKKGLIHKTGVKEYGGRKHSQFCITSNGVFLALDEGIPLNRLLVETKQIYPDNHTFICYLEVASKLNPEVLRIGYSALERKGKIEPVDLATMMFTEMQTETQDETYREIVDTIKAHPQKYRLFKKRIEKMLETLSKLNEIT